MKVRRIKKLYLFGAFLMFIALWLINKIHIYNGLYKTCDHYKRAFIENMKEETQNDELTKSIQTEESLRDVVVDELIERLNSESRDFFPVDFFNIPMNELTRRLGKESIKNSRKLSEFAQVNMSAPLPAWNLTCANIRQHALYDPNDKNVDTLMHDMATLPIQSVKRINDGSQLNLLAILKDGTKTVMKPMRYPRNRDELNDTFYFDFMERHSSEIAAFHLDKVLGLYRVPPTVGRKVNIMTELMSVAEKNMRKTVFKSEVNNTCFYGLCGRWCDVAHAYCGKPDVIEVCVMMFLPQYLQHVPLPWRRSFTHKWKSDWETKNICKKVRKQDVFNDTRILREAIDAYLFDYMTGNEDRHTFYYHEEFNGLTYSVLNDNGKGFGRHAIDTPLNLQPLLQCCLLKKSTVLKFIKLYVGPEKISSLMERALSSDPVAPILTTGHLQALDRRVVKVLRAMATCINKHGINKVIKDAIL